MDKVTDVITEGILWACMGFALFATISGLVTSFTCN